MAGAYTGSNYIPSLFAPGGKSLHPLQRAGVVPDAGIPNTPAAGGGGMSANTPAAAPLNLGQPAHLAIVNPAVGGTRSQKFMT
jgi:hypothetical protein